MQWTSLNDLREKYLSFFESKGHLRLPSYPLVPINDRSLLLINSGMAPMKKFFTGEETPPRKRVTTCQKCIRTPDLDRVGHTARHGTYFEMLGNFSFGDYFKDEAIPWAWEFLTETLEIPANLLWPSIYENDEQAYDIWRNRVGVPAEHIVRLGKADNFWEHGTGPCGPCSEIYFDRGEKYGCGSPDCKPGCDCDRYMEIWNNVFTQFSNDGNGNYTELSQKNIDTGMGLERLACVMQGVDNLFEVDTVRKILNTVCAIAGKTYGENAKDDIAIRVVTDHIRSATFMISDGVIPSNEGRGYVLRRILRRACRNGRLLGIDRSFLSELCEVVIGENIGAYPELGEKKAYILKVIRNEEERFDATIDAGLSILSNVIRASIEAGHSVISGEDAFRLYDTFGFPLDLTREIVAEKQLEIDEETFKKLMQEQRDRARNARGNISGWDDSSKKMLASLPATVFCGYETTALDARVLAIIAEGEYVDAVSEGECTVILDNTPFYGESGGQIGDIGTLSADGLMIHVDDTKKSDGIYLHNCSMVNGVLHVGDTVRAAIDVTTHTMIQRSHSACHLLQAALRQVLGTHVEQAGSYVACDRVRFDFTHFAALTEQELNAVEALVNSYIFIGEPITMQEMPIEEARKLGAMALFGEKYGDTVRVVRMGNFSTEFCGGTHLDNTARIGMFKIVSETSVAAGVRRIEAVTGTEILRTIYDQQALIRQTAAELRTQNPTDIAKKAAQLQGDLHNMKKELDALNQKLAATQTGALVSNAVAVGSCRLATALLHDVLPDAARTLCDTVRDQHSDIVLVLALVNGDKLNFLVSCGKDAVAAGANAGKLVGAIAAIADGKGGGRPDNAMAGARDLSKAEDALAAAESLLQGFVK